jgi:hypothetical protein
MRYIALEEAFSIPGLDDRQPSPWLGLPLSQRHLADWARKLPDFTEYRLPEMDAGIDDRWKVLDGRPELYGATWSWAAEVGGHALRIIYGGVFDRHPGATLILGHMGEFLPFMRSRLDSLPHHAQRHRPAQDRPPERRTHPAAAA